MKTKIWIELLNEESEWRSLDELKSWFEKFSGRTETKIEARALDKFRDSLRRIRRLLYEQHFGNELDLSWLNAELATMQLAFCWPQKEKALAPLQATEPSRNDSEMSDSAVLNSLRVSVILQFAQDLSENLGQGQSPLVQRCEGLYRDHADLSSKSAKEEKIAEKLWRQEIPALTQANSEQEKEIQRCADFFSSDSRSRFCSDKCRFSTFQIVKQLKDPSYLAQKQKRYRAKKS